MQFKDFCKDIGIPEFKAIIGNKYEKLMILTILFFISLLGLGIANSLRIYLKEKMKDPFIQYMDVEKNSFFTVKGKASLSKKNIEKKIIENTRYNNDTVDLQIEKFFTGIEKNFSFKYNNNTIPLYGLLLSTEDDFYRELEFISGEGKFSNDGFGIIITEEFLRKLNISIKKDTTWKNISFIEVENKSKNFSVKIPVAGIVKKLRRNAEFVFSENFLKCWESDYKVFKKDYYVNSKTYFLPNQKDLPKDLLDEYTLLDNKFAITKNCHVKGILIETDSNTKVLNKIKYPNAINVLNITKNNLYSETTFRMDKDFFTFKLKKLDNVEKFVEAIFQEFGIRIEEGNIENKKNLDLFNGIIRILYASLIIFTIVSIIFFITNILISHLNVNKRSIGTLKAFGLSNGHIVGLYSTISLFIIIITFIFAYISSEILGDSILGFYLNSMNIEMISYKNIDILWLVTFMVFIPLILVLYRVFAYTNHATPGDLIYERK